MYVKYLHILLFSGKDKRKVKSFYNIYIYLYVIKILEYFILSQFYNRIKLIYLLYTYECTYVDTYYVILKVLLKVKFNLLSIL